MMKNGAAFGAFACADPTAKIGDCLIPDTMSSTMSSDHYVLHTSDPLHLPPLFDIADPPAPPATPRRIPAV
jgi:hypothetical protein